MQLSKQSSLNLGQVWRWKIGEILERKNFLKKRKRLFYRGTGSKIAMSQKEAWELSWVGMVQRSLTERQKIFWGRSIKGWGVWKARGEFCKSCSGPFLNLMYHCMLVILTYCIFLREEQEHYQRVYSPDSCATEKQLSAKHHCLQDALKRTFPFFPFFNLPRIFSPRQMMRVAVKSTQLEVGH